MLIKNSTVSIGSISPYSVQMRENTNQNNIMPQFVIIALICNTCLNL